MQPTSPTPPAARSEPVIELVRTQRQNVGYALLVASAVCLALTGWLALKTSRISAPAEAPKNEKGKLDDPFARTAELSQPSRFDYVIGALGAFEWCVTFGGIGAALLARRPKPTLAEQHTEARLVVLVLGSSLGSALIVLGATYFYNWSESVTKWLDQGERAEARWVLTPLLIVVVGGALTFVAAQPARAEERNNARVRQFIYGSNFGLTVLMLFVVLVIVNVVVALRVPNKLDTTQTGMYTLSPQTKQLLEALEQPVQAYSIFQENDPVAEDLNRLLANCQDAARGKFRVTLLNPALNKAEIAKLRSDYPQAELSREGLLLVAGGEGDRNRHSFLRADEFEESKPDAQGRQVPVFNGEPKLLRELLFLAENKQKPKVYFTQSSGELALAGGADRRRSAAGLKAYLEKNYFEVVPLKADPGAPARVPDDATAVVIADPTATLPPALSDAIRDYMTRTLPDGRKGKLVVLAGQQPGADGKPLVTGVEPVLQSFGVRLSDRFLYAAPNDELGALDRARGTRVMLGRLTQEAVDARNPVALGFNRMSALALLDCRELAAAPGGNAKTVTLFLSDPGRETWSPPRYEPDPARAWGEFTQRVNRIFAGAGTLDEKRRAAQPLVAEMQISDEPRPLVVFASEGPTARVAVFGCGWFASDDAERTASDRFGARNATVWLDLMGSTLDWVRDRPTVSGPSEKQYTVYQLQPGYSSLRLIWVPLGLALVSVAGLGAGVWVIRRK
ncbi:GldG family protein [Gemmata sp. JC717]|uniref:GldG family protein n=1 Tax=Gemmata algarum TaxID=2975278 RepID=UPI0021BAE266|nr:GldG family protein [Gemmata algarum]MDY3554674.1 GldG family protein [Gemmata algarum]